MEEVKKMKGEIIEIHVLESKYSKIIDVIKTGNLYVGRFQDGVCILINNKAQDKEFKGIMYNPNSFGATRFELSENDFQKMFVEVILKHIKENYKIEDNENDMIEQFDSIANALFAKEKGNYKNYMVGKKEVN